MFITNHTISWNVNAKHGSCNFALAACLRMPKNRSCPDGYHSQLGVDREIVLFIGTQFSNLYTAVDTLARGRVGCVCVWCLCVSMYSDILWSLSL